MKKLLNSGWFWGIITGLIACFLLAHWCETSAQSVVRKGNTFYQQSSSKKTIQKDSAVTLTPYTYVIKDVKYLVYKSSRGSYFIIRTNKKGEQYRKYVTKEITKK